MKILMILTFALYAVTAAGQSECKVLLPALSGSYEGGCRKGLADGDGVAIGTDTYKGSFKKGLPDGEGTYTWSTGAVYTGQWKKGMRDGYGTFTYPVNEMDSIQDGHWRADVYIGKEHVAPYVIQNMTGIRRASFHKQGKGDSYVTFKFERSGNTTYEVDGLIMQGSSGEESIVSSFTGFQHASFPFEGRVRFQAPSLLSSSTFTYEMRFVINEPGDWLITIYY
ncbi:MAG: hypothetical protein PHO11_02895 [Bacteroidales bacterium]|mgnify:CR=1 FL=1|nr:hypothetical protein [Bacteroidales bacterium]